MPVELRKRKAPAVEPAAAPPAKKKDTVAKAVAKAKEVFSDSSKNDKSADSTAASKSQITVGQTINLDGFGGEVETHDGAKTTLKQLVEESTAGVVLFTYPKASTPGCTTQACAFRDYHSDFTGTGFSVYGLSKDLPKANSTFKGKQRLPYTLLCDPKSTLIAAIGLKKAPANTWRGVFVIDKSGKVLAAEQGGPMNTLDTAKRVTKEHAASGDHAVVAPTPTAAPEATETAPAPPVNGDAPASKEDIVQAETAAQVADTAQKIDAA